VIGAATAQSDAILLGRRTYLELAEFAAGLATFDDPSFVEVAAGNVSAWGRSRVPEVHRNPGGE
jgi:hypothetical protein